MKLANIKVAVRIRPLLEDERKQGHTCTKLDIDQETKSINVYNDRTSIYKNSQFDFVLDQTSSQRRTYDRACVGDLVKAVVDGYHATVFAYGQTGSGKSFTMEGYKYKINEKGEPVPILTEFNNYTKTPPSHMQDNDGLVPRAIHHLFDMIKQQNNLQKKKFTVYCSYLQVYKEKIYDLLNKATVKRIANDAPGLKLRWNKYDHFTVENLYTFECRSPEDVMALYHFGIKNKVVASHAMNNQSSRSHTMLSITVEQVDASNPDNIITSKLQMVDLAGSERQAFTGNQANKESIDINKSLFTLRQVITALTDKKAVSANSYIPYRESKLTSLLRHSLGGNSYCLMIACLNPCDMFLEENISTLQYASKASYISNKPIKNDDPKMRLIEQLKKENKLLHEELAQANETIQFLSQLTGNNPKTVQRNLKNVKMPGDELTPGTDDGDPSQKRQNSASSARTERRTGADSAERRLIITERIIKDKDNIEKFFKEKSETLQNIATISRPGALPSAVNETKDAITERIIHTVNMMKEVLQSNLSLRETIQKQSEQLDNQNADFFMLQIENEDLRDRLGIFEEYTGKDSYLEMAKLVKEKKVLENRVKHLEKTSMNWAAAQFQATKSGFNTSNDNFRQTHQGGGGGMPQQQTHYSQSNTFIQGTNMNATKMTIMDTAPVNQFDDYEPVRCININESQTTTKKKKKIQQINMQRQIQAAANQQLRIKNHSSQFNIGEHATNSGQINNSIQLEVGVNQRRNTVRNLGGREMGSFKMSNQQQTTKSSYQNSAHKQFMQTGFDPQQRNSTAFSQQMNTFYMPGQSFSGGAQAQNSSQSFYQGGTLLNGGASRFFLPNQQMYTTHNQTIADDHSYHENGEMLPDTSVQMRKSPLLGGPRSTSKLGPVHHNEYPGIQQQRNHSHAPTTFIVGGHQQHHADIYQSTNPNHKQMHRDNKFAQMQKTYSSFTKPPRSTDKVRSLIQKQATQRMGNQNLNISAEYANRLNNTFDSAESPTVETPQGFQRSSGVYQNYYAGAGDRTQNIGLSQNQHAHTNDETQEYDEEEDEGGRDEFDEAYEALMYQQQHQSSEVSPQRRDHQPQVDVSLPFIKNSSQPAAVSTTNNSYVAQTPAKPVQPGQE